MGEPRFRGQFNVSAICRGFRRRADYAIEHAFVMCRDEVIGLEHLPQKIIDSARAPGRTRANALTERAIISESLDRHAGNRQKTARELGMHRSTLWRKLRQYGLGE